MARVQRGGFANKALPSVTPSRTLWHHDLFHPDGTPYDPQEIALFRRHLRR